MIAFLSKPYESIGFEQIIDFLIAHPIKYTLTVSPTIYSSCIEQFWATAKVKHVNEEAKLHAKVDGKRVVISEASIKSNLRFGDEGGIACLPNEAIFEQLTLMGYEKLSQKLTFYKAFFSLQWKFLIHTILQCIRAKKTAWNEFSITIAYLEEIANHTRIYVPPSHTKMIFGNIKRVGQGFLGRVTSLFPTMLVQAQQEVDEGIEIPTDTQQTPTIIQPTTSQPQRKQKKKKPRRKDTELPQTSVPTEVVADKAIYKEMYDSVERATTIATGLDAEHDRGIISKTQFMTTLNEPSSIGTSSGSGPKRHETVRDAATQTREDRLQLTKLMELCTQLQSRVLALETTKTNQALEIGSLKRRMKKLEKKANKRTHTLKRLYKIGSSRRIESSDEASLGDQEDASKQGRIIDNLNADEGVTLEVSTVDPVTTADEVVTTAGLKDSTTATPTISMDDITLPKALAALKSAKLMVKDKNRAEGSETRAEGSSKRAGEELESDKSKSQKLDKKVEVKEDNDQEEAEMKMYMKIISNDEIAIDAIPLATKPPIVVDWKIIKEGKIIHIIL
uniref:Xylulose kinase-1 n=1 Tax=Tanacetum cinerariifolium TaxID=118510 RepID=A0A6L2KFF1_TANCI|nr:hypothetical protein [Tanacetum cinerariifolium]